MQNILPEEYFCSYHNFYSIEIYQVCKKVCSGEQCLSLYMYHSFECFQKKTDISKRYHNYSLKHAQAKKSPRMNKNLPKEQYATHQNKTVQTLNYNDFNFIAETSNFDHELNYHNHSSPIYGSSLLNHQTEFINRIKNTIEMKHNLAEIDLLKIIHDLKCPISAYDIIVGWATRWDSNNVVFDSGSSYKFNKQVQLLNDLATTI